MVKLHDLVDLAEPPWQNLEESSTSERSRDEVMAWDVEMAEQDEEVVEPQANLGEIDLGLG